MTYSYLGHIFGNISPLFFTWVYFQTKQILADNAVFSSSDNEPVDSAFCYNSNESGPRIIKVRIRLGPRLSKNAIDRLEMEAAKVLVLGVTSLLLISLPLIAYLLGMTICNKWSNIYCNDTYGWLSPYLKQFGQVHGVYHPIIYMAWSEKFCRKKKNCDCCVWWSINSVGLCIGTSMKNNLLRITLLKKNMYLFICLPIKCGATVSRDAVAGTRYRIPIVLLCDALLSIIIKSPAAQNAEIMNGIKVCLMIQLCD